MKSQSGKKLLALSNSDPSITEADQNIDSLNIISSYTLKYQSVGKSIQKVVKKVLNRQLHQNTRFTQDEKREFQYFSSSEDQQDDDAQQDDKEQFKTQAEAQQRNKEKFQKKRKAMNQEKLLKQALVGDDHYGILGLQKLKLQATQKDIKIAYRKLALIHHPDKKIGEIEAKIEKQYQDKKKPDDFVLKEHPQYKKMELYWHKIQDAYQCLMDPDSRYRYDSTMPFDDDIPDQSDDITDQNFFEIFEPVFERNAQFSKIKPVPNLGDSKLSYQQTCKFYDFWYDFKSWRDFSQHDEYDLKQAENRYEKRYMERQNKKIRQKYLKKERKRIISLVDTAFKFDPRINAQALKVQAEKDKKKQQKREKIQKQKQRLLQIQIAQEKKKKQIQDQKAQEQMERKKQILRKKKEQLTIQLEFISIIQNSKSKKYDKYWAEEFVKQCGLERIKNFNSMAQEKKVKAQQIEKSIALLQEQQNKIKKQEQKARKKIAKQEKQQQKEKSKWQTKQLALLAKGNVKFPIGLKNRWKLISDFIGTRTIKEVIQKSKQIAENKPKQGVAVYKPPSTQTQGGEQIMEVNGNIKKQVQPKAEKKEVKKSDIPAQGWSGQQQKQLQTALRKYPATLPPKQRWQSIADDVIGKTAKQCLTRYKEIVDMIKKKKAS